MASKRARARAIHNGSIQSQPLDDLQRYWQEEVAAPCVCPRCQGPMSARYGRAGPYFHCRCYEPAAELQSLCLPAEPTNGECAGSRRLSV